MTGPSALTVGAPTTAPVAPDSFDPAKTVPYLASDALEGRGIGLPGLDAAADFLAGRFKASGLKPLPGLDGYFQPFDYTAASAPGSDCALAIDGRALKLDEDYRPLVYTGEGNFDGLVVFAGYGITSTTHNYDDYAGLDVAGKVVLAMRFEPMTAGGKSLWAAAGSDWSPEASLENKARTAAAHGAAALLLFTPQGLESEDVLAPFSPGYHPVAGAIPAFHVKRNVAASILGAGTTIQYPPQGKPSAEATQVADVGGAVHIARTVLHVKNIVGCVPGTGPHADEYVVVGAHYDHLGRGKYGVIFGRPGAIYHGADDNASGAAAVVELAQHAAAGPARQRTLVFCLFTAEEEGLIGSEYFTAHPPIDLANVVAMFNMDMVGRVVKDTVYVGGEGTAADLEALVKTAERGQPLTAKSLPASVGGRGGLGPSDHMEFALKGIPIVFLYSGMHADYHRPTDTADKINYAGIGEVVAFGDRLLDGLAGMPRQKYDSSADLRTIAPPGASSSDHLSGAALGVIPDYTTESNDVGVLIQGVRPGSAADTAGLQAGDLLLQFGDKKLVGLQDLADCLAMARPGDKVTIIVQRGKQRLELHATLERKG